MPDRMFYVRAQDKEGQPTDYVGAKFVMLGGKPVVDPTPGGSQNAYIYADGSDKYKIPGKVANPNNYLIVPDIYTEQKARAFAAEVANTMNQSYSGDDGLTGALGKMFGAFWPNGSQEHTARPAVGNKKRRLRSGIYRRCILSPGIRDAFGRHSGELV